jgi:hypothetical protein
MLTFIEQNVTSWDFDECWSAAIHRLPAIIRTVRLVKALCWFYPTSEAAGASDDGS